MLSERQKDKIQNAIDTRLDQFGVRTNLKTSQVCQLIIGKKGSYRDLVKWALSKNPYALKYSSNHRSKYILAMSRKECYYSAIYVEHRTLIGYCKALIGFDAHDNTEARLMLERYFHINIDHADQYKQKLHTT